MYCVVSLNRVKMSPFSCTSLIASSLRIAGPGVTADFPADDALK